MGATIDRHRLTLATLLLAGCFGGTPKVEEPETVRPEAPPPKRLGEATATSSAARKNSWLLPARAGARDGIGALEGGGSALGCGLGFARRPRLLPTASTTSAALSSATSSATTRSRSSARSRSPTTPALV